MFWNYLKITFRSMARHREFTVINILGLALSMAICLLIILFVRDEMRCDAFHRNRERMARVITTDTKIEYSYIKGWATSPAGLAYLLSENCPGVEKTARCWNLHANAMLNRTPLPVSGIFSDPSFFDIFDFRLQAGDPATALSEPYTIVLTRESADRFFGDEDPVGKVLELETYGQFRVTGVFEDRQWKSHFKFGMVASFSTVYDLARRGIFQSNPDSWESFTSCYTYVLLKDGGYESLHAGLPAMADVLFPEVERPRLGLATQRLKDINLGWNLINEMPGTKHSFEIVFIPLVAGLILILACFNYVNLSIARSMRRTREIGLRKVIGADRGHIVRMFLGEAFVMTLLSLVVASLLVLWMVPVLNGMGAVVQSKNTINLDMMKNADVYIYFVLFAFAVSIMAGLYPALYLSSFKPVDALKGVCGIRTSRRYLLRKILIGSQFGVSMVAIITILFIHMQFSFMRSYDRGIDTSNVACLSLLDADYSMLRGELLQSGDITTVCASSGVPGHQVGFQVEIRHQKMTEPVIFSGYSVDEAFIGAMGLKVLAGRGFSEEFTTDRQSAAMINEKALQVFGFASPQEAIGEVVGTSKNSYTIIGVLRDFNYRDLHSPLEPLIVFDRPDSWFYALVSFVPGSRDKVRSYISDVWSGIDEIHPADVEFIADMDGRADSFAKDVIRIAGSGSGLIIAIALMGLLGITSYSMEMKVKEVGVRKVLGAGTLRIISILSGEMAGVIVVATAVALPVAWLINRMMLQSFAYRVPLSAWIFAGGAGAVIFLALGTIASQTVRAALANPVESLREE